ncbi:MAG: VapC toxin family PIN domain ribonuclease [Planctomycetota bacterium]|nr:MAG: VapC toxin family PIN domain ribonuclease [Planctomycetota bacterium]
MSAAFVIDCSMTMAWCFADERTALTTQVRDRAKFEVAVAPALWRLEVANVLVRAERRGRITPALSAEFVQLLDAMKIEIDDAGCVFDHVLPLCRQHDLTAYDAAYLELALRRRLPLATLDERLRLVASQQGVGLLGR